MWRRDPPAQSFTDRADAGRRLAAAVADLFLANPVVLGLPRGGVVVARRVADTLNCPLDVLVARKIGAPRQPEYGVGAIAEGGEPIFDLAALAALRLTEADMEPFVAAERRELQRRVALYRGGRALPDLAARDVVLADDGLATGVTARAAVDAVRRQRPQRLVLAVPVGAPATVESFRNEVDDVVCLLTPTGFSAVGAWYASFDQTSDDEVLELLATRR